jgi:hypothetical protein
MRKEKYRRYKYFDQGPVIQWGKMFVESSLQKQGGYFAIINSGFDSTVQWEINFPVVRNNDDVMVYQSLHTYSANGSNFNLFNVSGAPKLKNDSYFKSFKDAFMAAKELREIYANLPIKVVEVSGEEGVIIGTSDAEEVAAILTYS